MWIVRLALRRPYSVATFCIVVALLAALAIPRMKVDVLPAIDLPVVIVVWNYPGLTAEEMEKRVVYLTERAFSTSVDNVERIESQSILGIGIVKVYFQPDADIGGAIAQISATCQSVLRGMPPGMTAPTILRYNASNVPVAQVTMRGASEQQLFDYGLNFLRLRLFTVPGLATPAPYGGRQREVMVEVDPAKLAASGLSPQDVVNAITASNVILPAGTARLGKTEYDVLLNGSPTQVDAFNQLPLRQVGNRTVLLGDVAHVYDGYAVQQNIVRIDGRRATYLSILKKSNASTLAVVDATRDMLPTLQKAAPDGVELKLDFDQSVFVRGAVTGVLREGTIAAALVSLMVLFFLGSWRSTLVVCTSIPIAVLCGVLGLFLTGHSLNLMTLGGMALAIGMLVDDATVEVENIHRNRHMNKGLTQAILDGAHQIALPALAATATLCIVFFPVVLLTGPARFLFQPLAVAVVVPLIASYLLSRTLVPALARKLLRHDQSDRPETRFGKFNRWRDARFDDFRARYARVLTAALAHRALVLAAFALLVATAGLLLPVVGLDFFPTVDTGQMNLHVRAPTGTRIEETERIVSDIEQTIRATIPAGELEMIADNLGIPQPYNLAFIQSDNAGGQDAELRVELKKKHGPTREYQRKLRTALREKFPGVRFYFQDADLVSQVLNFGVPAPIDVQIASRDADKALEVAQQLVGKISRVPGATDVRIAQIYDHPALRVNVDRQRAQAIGLTERDVANALITSLSSSQLTAPSFWINPQTGVNYPVVVQTPIAKVQSVDDLEATPLSAGQAGAATGTAAPYLGGVSLLETLQDKSLISHQTVQPVLDVECAVDGRDLGAVAREIEAAVNGMKLPDGVLVSVRGQSESMFTAFGRLGLGLIVAIALVYLVLVVLFQSWIDPLVILIAVPGAFIGIAWMLALTGTSLNVESFMGAIMAVGIATSNSILLVSFANDHREANPRATAVEAALAAGRTRLRPVIMTALAMILGMLPMALGLGEGGEQNAPLGRAVIGGLLVATLVTLLVVPAFYTLVRRAPPRKAELADEIEREAHGDGQADDHRDAPQPRGDREQPLHA